MSAHAPPLGDDPPPRSGEGTAGARGTGPEGHRAAVLEAIERDVEGWLARHEQKELCRFVTVGSVDDGKSTLIGRLLYDTDNIFDDHLAAVKKASAKKGEAIDLSLFTDGLVAEREQGITIDVAYRYFATERRKFIIADTPGHEQYTRNMATGASTADVGIILVDATQGVLPQTRRHATITSLLGVRHLVCAVNKMDLAAWREDAYRRAAGALGELSRRLHFESIHLVPISAKLGDNVVERGVETPWYDGPTILELLETLPVGRDRGGEPFRLPVQTVLRPDHTYRAFAGQIASGSIAAGDEVVVLPSRRRTRVRAIDTYEGSLTHAFAPMSVALRLADEVDASRGETICKAGEEPAVATEVEARVVWLSERPFDPARKLLLKHGSRVVPARVTEVLGRTSLETLELAPAGGAMALNDIALARIAVTRPIFCDPYRVSRGTGAFILVDAMENGTVAAGMIERAVETRGDDRGPVTGDERALRVGHAGAVVLLGARGDAAAVERVIFDAGLSTLLVSVADVTPGSLLEVAVRAARAGLVVLVEGEAGAAAAELMAKARLVDGRGRAADELATQLGAALAVGQRP
jgi:bifunctional enzyme CysN/CysC/sulfate adenylyltransferase subunit 1